MKTTHIILAAVLAATSAIQAATAEHKLPAPLPEFKTPEQLAVWRKEMAAKAAAADALAAKEPIPRPQHRLFSQASLMFRKLAAIPSSFVSMTRNFLDGHQPIRAAFQMGLIIGVMEVRRPEVWMHLV